MWDALSLSHDDDARKSDCACVCRGRRSSSWSSPRLPTCPCTSAGGRHPITAKCSSLTRWTSVTNALWSKARLCSSRQVSAAVGSKVQWRGGCVSFWFDASLFLILNMNLIPLGLSLFFLPDDELESVARDWINLRDYSRTKVCFLNQEKSLLIF